MILKKKFKINVKNHKSILLYMGFLPNVPTNFSLSITTNITYVLVLRPDNKSSINSNIELFI